MTSLNTLQLSSFTTNDTDKKCAVDASYFIPQECESAVATAKKLQDFFIAWSIAELGQNALIDLDETTIQKLDSNSDGYFNENDITLIYQLAKAVNRDINVAPANYITSQNVIDFINQKAPGTYDQAFSQQSNPNQASSEVSKKRWFHL